MRGRVRYPSAKIHQDRAIPRNRTEAVGPSALGRRFSEEFFLMRSGFLMRLWKLTGYEVEKTKRHQWQCMRYKISMSNLKLNS